METSLHRDLKRIYAGQAGQTEVRCGRFRIDAIVGEELVEIQHASLASIRRKIARLLSDHAVRIVKPIVAEKTLVKLARRGGRVVERRKSPKRGSLLDIFHELIYFTQVFPHPRLALEVLLVDVEEHRYPGHGRRRRYGRRDFETEDQRLLLVRDSFRLTRSDDLRLLLGSPPQGTFDTAALAQALQIDRWFAQRIAYCLRKMGAVRTTGKRGNAHQYAWSVPEGHEREAA